MDSSPNVIAYWNRGTEQSHLAWSQPCLPGATSGAHSMQINTSILSVICIAVSELLVGCRLTDVGLIDR
jgi:hypothetical protein